MHVHWKASCFVDCLLNVHQNASNAWLPPCGTVLNTGEPGEQLTMHITAQHSTASYSISTAHDYRCIHALTSALLLLCSQQLPSNYQNLCHKQTIANSACEDILTTIQQHIYNAMAYKAA
jgi:hypothetical protein